jgi:hypothetical protein
MNLADFTFDEFWKIYPRRVGRKVAARLWEKIPMIERPRVIQVLKMWKCTAQWHDSDGQFIPYASTFLNQERWKDEPWTGAFEEANLQQFN